MVRSRNRDDGRDVDRPSVGHRRVSAPSPSGPRGALARQVADAVVNLRPAFPDGARRITAPAPAIGEQSSLSATPPITRARPREPVDQRRPSAPIVPPGVDLAKRKTRAGIARTAEVSDRQDLLRPVDTATTTIIAQRHAAELSTRTGDLLYGA